MYINYFVLALSNIMFLHEAASISVHCICTLLNCAPVVCVCVCVWVKDGLHCAGYSSCLIINTPPPRVKLKYEAMQLILQTLYMAPPQPHTHTHTEGMRLVTSLTICFADWSEHQLWLSTTCWHIYIVCVSGCACIGAPLSWYVGAHAYTHIL